MSIFKKKTVEQDRSQFEFEDSFAKSEHSVNSNTPVPPMQQRQPMQGQPPSPAAAQASRTKRRISYSIEDAILLMRELPSDQRDMVVSIVQKTLSSANISVADILDDAARKLNRLGTRKSQLNKEIAELEAGIKERQSEIEKITIDSEETETVKVSFEAASGIPLDQTDQHEPSHARRDSNSTGPGSPQNINSQVQTQPPGIPSNNAS